MLTEKEIGDNDELQDAFVRYNAYRQRMLSQASEKVFRNEICLIED
jgi:hypothetical protein